jgi:hypothetical protein
MIKHGLFVRQSLSENYWVMDATRALVFLGPFTKQNGALRAPPSHHCYSLRDQ